MPRKKVEKKIVDAIAGKPVGGPPLKVLDGVAKKVLKKSASPAGTGGGPVKPSTRPLKLSSRPGPSLSQNLKKAAGNTKVARKGKKFKKKVNRQAKALGDIAKESNKLLSPFGLARTGGPVRSALKRRAVRSVR